MAKVKQATTFQTEISHEHRLECQFSFIYSSSVNADFLCQNFLDSISSKKIRGVWLDYFTDSNGQKIDIICSRMQGNTINKIGVRRAQELIRSKWSLIHAYPLHGDIRFSVVLEP
jgi:hypothetical protein